MKKIFAITFLALYIVPAMASAAALSPYWGPLVSCVGASTPGSSLPVCSSFCDLLATAQNFIKFGTTIALYIIAPILFVWGGVMLMTARGSETQMSEARKMLTSTVIGIAIVLAAFVIVNTFFYAFSVVFKNPEGTAQSSWSAIQCEVKPMPGSSCGGATYGYCPAGQSCLGSSPSYSCGTVD